MRAEVVRLPHVHMKAKDRRALDRQRTNSLRFGDSAPEVRVNEPQVVKISHRKPREEW